jgi:hypothetical protein
MWFTIVLVLASLTLTLARTENLSEDFSRPAHNSTCAGLSPSSIEVEVWSLVLIIVGSGLIGAFSAVFGYVGYGWWHIYQKPSPHPTTLSDLDRSLNGLRV